MRKDIQALRERAMSLHITSLSETRRFLMEVLDVLDRLDTVIADHDARLLQIEATILETVQPARLPELDSAGRAFVEGLTTQGVLHGAK